MAGDWIKIEKSTARKPEVLAISSALAIHPDHAFGLCVRFWAWCDDQLENGHADSVTNVTLDFVIGHNGFAQQLIRVGWLKETESGIDIPNFDYHLSESAKTRAQAAKRKSKSRAERDKCHGEVVTKTRPEKRREESLDGEPSVSVSNRFTKPNISQLESYAIELAHPEFDAEAFIDHFDSNGWKVGGKAAMKDWKAAVRTWIKRNKPKPKPKQLVPRGVEQMEEWYREVNST